MRYLIVFVFALLMSLLATAQSEQELLDQLLQEEKNSVEALVLYPEQTRRDILEACLHPEAIVKLESMQSKTSEAFKNLMQDYAQETQELIWDLTRYPGLITKLAMTTGQSDSEVRAKLADYPAEVHPKALEARRYYFDLLLRVDELNEQWRRTFDNLIRDYPDKTQDALRQLVELPEVLTLLSDGIRMTVMVGDLYRRNPAWLMQQLDSLNLVVAREHTREIEDWKAGLEADPEAKAEFARSAEDFAREYNYDDSYYPYDDVYESGEVREVVVEHHYYHHYPYWFGYPYWYTYPRWRPYPVWYDWGFYWGPGRVIVIIDMPSYYFTNWYFYYPHHHYYYPQLSSHFTRHYYGHRHHGGSITAGVDNWRRNNREIITDEWLDKARYDKEKFREYGKFESSREKYNQAHPAKAMTPSEYLDKNKRQYPVLAKERPQPAQPEKEIRKDKEVTPPVQKPRTEPAPKKDPVVIPPKTEPKESRKETPIPKTQPDKKAPAEMPKVDKARDYHRDKWEQPKATPKKETTTPKTEPRKETPTPKTQPKKETTVKRKD